MKKTRKKSITTLKKTIYKFNDKVSLVREEEALYTVHPTTTAKKLFDYKKFRALALKLPFTLKEWAAIIDLSDRTLQRYASENKAFEGIHADRLFQIEKLVREAAKAFTAPIHFYNWLKEEPIVLNHKLSPASLQTQDGIQLIFDELGRMQQGVYI